MSAERKPIGINHLTVKPRNFNPEDKPKEANEHTDSENDHKDTENSEK